MTHRIKSRNAGDGPFFSCCHAGPFLQWSVLQPRSRTSSSFTSTIWDTETLGAYGCTDIPTPNIDRLAKEGVRCTASYITNPPCCPSRCSLMMGQYGQRFGKYGMSRGLPIPEDRPTLARFLSDHGYVTGQIGKWDIGTKQQGPLNVGFTEVAKNPAEERYTKEELAVPKSSEQLAARTVTQSTSASMKMARRSG